MLVTLIIICEISFWILVLSGLTVRYIIQKKKIGSLLLLSTPIVDMILLIITILDLRSDNEAGFFHGLAAIYIGVSLAFGRKMIRWADERFSYRFAGGPLPVKPPRYGAENAQHERKSWCMHLKAWIIGSLLLFAMIYFIDDSSKTVSLLKMIQTWGGILLIDFFYSFSFSLWPRKKRRF